MNPKMTDALNKQINEELFSSYLYLSMSAYFESIGLKGFANWMKIQAQEEDAHAKKLFNFIIERGHKVILDQIKAPKNEWQNPLEAFSETLEHEKHITKCINSLVDLSQELRDHATQSFLNWYVDEQVEEEASANEIIENLKIANNNGNAILLLDRELAGRVFVDPLSN